MRKEQFWFLDTLVAVRIAHADGTDGISVLEHRARFGDSPPLHIHRTEDEIFNVLEGEFLLHIENSDRKLEPGAIVIAPKGIAHTYRVDSAGGGRWLTVTARGDFERFVRAIGRPAEGSGLPPPAGQPSPQAIEALVAAAHKYGIDIVGPPLH